MKNPREKLEDRNQHNKLYELFQHPFFRTIYEEMGLFEDGVRMDTLDEDFFKNLLLRWNKDLRRGEFLWRASYKLAKIQKKDIHIIKSLDIQQIIIAFNELSEYLEKKNSITREILEKNITEEVLRKLDNREMSYQEIRWAPCVFLRRKKWKEIIAGDIRQIEYVWEENVVISFTCTENKKYSPISVSVIGWKTAYIYYDNETSTAKLFDPIRGRRIAWWVEVSVDPDTKQPYIFKWINGEECYLEYSEDFLEAVLIHPKTGEYLLDASWLSVDPETKKPYIFTDIKNKPVYVSKNRVTHTGNLINMEGRISSKIALNMEERKPEIYFLEDKKVYITNTKTSSDVIDPETEKVLFHDVTVDIETKKILTHMLPNKTRACLQKNILGDAVRLKGDMGFCLFSGKWFLYDSKKKRPLIYQGKTGKEYGVIRDKIHRNTLQLFDFNVWEEIGEKFTENSEEFKKIASF